MADERSIDKSDSDVGVNEWVDLYGSYLFRHAIIRVGRREIAEELVQETFLSGLNSLANFERRSSVKTWLLSILRNKIIDHVRKAVREETFAGEGEESEETDRNFNRYGIWRNWLTEWNTGWNAEWKENPESVLEQKRFLGVLEGCIAKLPEKLRIVFVMKVMEDLDTKEICEDLSISTTNIWVILYRARMRLRECLDTRWFKSTVRDS